MPKQPEKKVSDAGADFLLYDSPDGGVRVRVHVEDETVWLTQKQMAELFGVDVRTVNEHLQNIFKTGELSQDSVIRNFRITAADGKSYLTQVYNLDAIISIGYRVNSRQATHFRKWATTVIRDYIIKGFAMDDALLKNGTRLGKDYFDELLERIRSIRASERRIHLKITDLFAECSLDYDPRSEITRDFFATVQNRFHYAITGKTAAEIIQEGADRNRPNMGLTTWKNAPKGRVLRSDVRVAKNYLAEADIRRLERLVSSYFDYIEHVVLNRNVLDMQGLADSINRFLGFNEYRILEGSGKIAMAEAVAKADGEYEAFNRNQPIESDFEAVIRRIDRS